ncbi:hypothetical protein COLO4_01460 [Corchorus olitorius]|uniref:Uncharacterized protein n=1 Tax=Corchorus olitorius TaxID=93759 RepID=A0A1R3L2H6_9ROSI|nr:hypothetical protein COLO4_01460 [Corchorus olitorius]
MIYLPYVRRLSCRTHRCLRPQSRCRRGAAQINNPVGQSNQHTTANNIAERNRDQIVENEVAEIECRKLSGSGAGELPEFRCGKIADQDGHRDQKHVGDAVLEAAADKHRHRQNHGNHLVSQAAAGIAHPDGQADQQIGQRTQCNGLYKTVMHLVIGGLQQIKTPGTSGNHMLTRQPDQHDEKERAAQITDVDIQPVTGQL